MEKISIIIPNYNGIGIIENCLSSVLSAVALEKRFDNEIIIIDNSSTDGSQNVIESYHLKYNKIKFIQLNKNSGYSGACHCGYLHSTGDYIVLLSNDTIVDRMWLVCLVNKILQTNDNIGAVQSKLLLMDYPDRIDSAGHVVDRTLFLRPKGYLEHDRGQYDNETNVCILQVVSCIFKRRTIDKVGGLFDPLYCIIHEDTDLSIRLHLGGFSIINCPDSIVYHKRSWSISRLPEQLVVYYTRRNALMTIIRNYETINVLTYGSLSCILYFFMMIYYSAKKQNKNTLAILYALKWNIASLNTNLKQRKNVQKQIRKMPDNFVFKSFDPFNLNRLLANRKYGALLTMHIKKQ